MYIANELRLHKKDEVHYVHNPGQCLIIVFVMQIADKLQLHAPIEKDEVHYFLDSV